MQLSISSKDIYEQDYNNQFQVDKKIYNDKIEYAYNDEYGKCKIIIYTGEKNEKIEIFRRGQVNSKQIFQLNKTNSFTYITAEMNAKYSIYSKKIEIFENKFMLEYDILDNEGIINQLKLEIKEV